MRTGKSLNRFTDTKPKIGMQLKMDIRIGWKSGGDRRTKLTRRY